MKTQKREKETKITYRNTKDGDRRRKVERGAKQSQEFIV